MGHVDLSPAAAVRRLARHWPDRVALWYEARSITYGEVDDAAGRLASVLAASGTGAGDRVAYLGLNSPAFLLTYLAAAWLRAVFVPVNFRLAADEVRQVLTDAAPHTLIVEPGHQAAADDAGTELAARRLVVDDDRATASDVRRGPAWPSLRDALAGAGAPSDPAPCHEGDLAMLAYTSGTTGRAKGVTLTHGNLWWNGANLDAAASCGPGDVNLVVAPLFHTAPFGFFTLRALTRGGTTVVRRSFDAGQTLADLAEQRVSAFLGVPAMYRAISRVPGFAEADLSALRGAVTSGAPAPRQLIAEYAARGVPLQQAYGLTEVLVATCAPATSGGGKPGSVGVPLPYTRVRLVEQGTGRDVGEPGVPGEVWVQAPTVSGGYWRGTPDGAAAFGADSWFRTGDIGHLDADGFLFVVDRVRDIIIVGGDNVYSGEVERVLGDCPGISEVAVVGAPDETWGEAVVAVVTAEPDRPPALDQVRDFAAARLAPYKLPGRLVVTDALPRNAMGKIDKGAIRAALAAPPGGPPPAAADAPEVPRAPWTRRLAGLNDGERWRLAVEVVRTHLAELSKRVEPARVTGDTAMLDLGLSSLDAVEFCGLLGAETGLRLRTAFVFDLPTVGALASYLCSAPEENSQSEMQSATHTGRSEPSRSNR